MSHSIFITGLVLFKILCLKNQMAQILKEIILNYLICLQLYPFFKWDISVRMEKIWYIFEGKCQGHAQIFLNPNLH